VNFGHTECECQNHTNCDLSIGKNYLKWTNNLKRIPTYKKNSQKTQKNGYYVFIKGQCVMRESDEFQNSNTTRLFKLKQENQSVLHLAVLTSLCSYNFIELQSPTGKYWREWEVRIWKQHRLSFPEVCHEKEEEIR
jgi:hypothetical protein